MNKTAKILLIVCACLVVTIVALLVTKPLWKKDNEPKVDEVVEEEDDGEELEIMLFDDEEEEKTIEEVIVPDEYLGYSESNFKAVIKGLGLKPVKQSTTFKSTSYKTGEVIKYESTSDGKVFKVGDSVKYWLVNNESASSAPESEVNNVTQNDGGNTSGGEAQEDTGITDNGDGSYTLPEVPLG